MQLRLRADGQTVELPPGKTTIGSSPRCNFRIERPGVAPVHCLIVRDANQLSVRRWAADTQLNGQPFDESPLAVGDCLVLAGVELELVGPPTANDTIEASIRQADVVASVCDAWMSNEQLPAVGDECLASEMERMAQDAYSVSALLVEEAWTPMADVLPQPAVEVSSQPVDEVVPECCEIASLDVTSAAEFVFRELQLACEVSRGRSRKLLAALREAREANRELTSLLAVARDELAELNRERLDWEQSQCERGESHGELEVKIQGLRREIVELENRLADHTRTMVELQTQLASTPTVAPQVFVPARENREVNVAVTPAFASPSTPLEPSADQFTATIESVEGSETDADAWAPPADKSAGWGEVLNRASEPIKSESSLWGASASQSEPKDDFLGGESAAPELDVDAPAWAAIDSVTNPEELESAASLFNDLSIWKQGAKASTANFGDAESEESVGESEPFTGWGNDAGGVAAFKADVRPSAPALDSPAEMPNPWKVPSTTGIDGGPAEVEEEAPVAAKLPQTSYIERYAHMFADEPAGEAPVEEPIRPAASESLVSRPPTMEVVRSENTAGALAASDDEESIEQYMAKLLQRVRGDSPHVPATQAAQAAATKQEDATGVSSLPPEATVFTPMEPLQTVDDEPETEEEAAQAMVDWEAIARRAVAAGPTANLGALRALANESARSAISRHELKKHRRDAVTKVIVSTLAGMTSLWLMLLAPNWRDIQFIAACVSLIVAGYWAGEAIRAMLESFRAAAYDGPSAEYGATGSYDGSLPIDVEASL